MLTRIVLERAGYRVIEAANGADGWTAFEKSVGRIDLALTGARSIADDLTT